MLLKTLDYNGGRCVDEARQWSRRATSHGLDQIPATRSENPQSIAELSSAKRVTPLNLLRCLLQPRLKLPQMIDVVPSCGLDQFSHREIAPFRMLGWSGHLLGGEGSN